MGFNVLEILFCPILLLMFFNQSILGKWLGMVQLLAKFFLNTLLKYDVRLGCSGHKAPACNLCWDIQSLHTWRQLENCSKFTKRPHLFSPGQEWVQKDICSRNSSITLCKVQLFCGLSKSSQLYVSVLITLFSPSPRWRPSYTVYGKVIF